MSDSKKRTGHHVKLAICGIIGLVVTFVTPTFHQKRQEPAVGSGSELGSLVAVPSGPGVTVRGKKTPSAGDNSQGRAAETTTQTESYGGY